MLEFMDNAIIGFKCRMVKAAEKFHDESGVSNFVATILLIVIVVALTAIFWTNIKDWFNTTWTKITGQADTIGG